MARDDYDVLVFKILAYFYTIIRGKQVFDQKKYDKAIAKKDINEEYLLRVYNMMAEEGLLENVNFTRAWGSDLIPLFDEKDIAISVGGIRYLEENDKMKKVGEYLLNKADVVATMLIEYGFQKLMQM